MSNRVHIEPTRFENVRSGVVTYGFRAYDQYAQTYNNTWDSIPDDDLECLKLAVADADDTLSSMLDYCREEEVGLFVGDTWFDWDEIKDILE
jgi:hypothetical protein